MGVQHPGARIRLFVDEVGNPISPGFTCGPDALQQWQIQLPGTFAFTADTRTELAFLNLDDDQSPSEFGSCVADVTCVSSVPEPGTLLLVGTGLAALAARRRFRSAARRSRGT